MKEPKLNSSYEEMLDPFVIAAQTDLDSACDLLFIHGNDLAWSQNERGLFLANVETDDNFEEVVQVVEARLKINIAALFSSFQEGFWTPMNVALYARVSTHDQQTLPMQLKAIAGVRQETQLECQAGDSGNRLRREGAPEARGAVERCPPQAG